MPDREISAFANHDSQVGNRLIATTQVERHLGANHVSFAEDSLKHVQCKVDAGVMRGIDDQFDDLPVDQLNAAVVKETRVRQFAELLGSSSASASALTERFSSGTCRSSRPKILRPTPWAIVPRAGFTANQSTFRILFPTNFLHHYFHGGRSGRSASNRATCASM